MSWPLFRIFLWGCWLRWLCRSTHATDLQCSLEDVWYASVHLAAQSMQGTTRVAKLANGSAQLDNGSHAVRGSNDSFSVTPLLAKVRRQALHHLGQCDSSWRCPTCS